jgi:translation initiation factor IF-2
MRLLQIGGAAVLALLGGGVARALAADKPAVAPTAAAPASKLDDKDAARLEYKRATAAFGLGQYGEAAKAYERAFRLVPDPAFLFDAAQAFRLAGRKPRALELYRNYLRLFPTGAAADEARRHIEMLEKQLQPPEPVAAPVSAAGAPAPVAPPSAAMAAPATPPPPPSATTSSPAPAQAPPPSTPGAVPPAPTPAPEPPGSPTSPTPAAKLEVVPPPTQAPPLVLAPEPFGGTLTSAPSAAESPALYRRPWFWAAAGGAALAIVVTGLVIARGGGEQPPRPTWHRIEIGGGP